MEGARRKILEKSPDDREPARASGKQGQRDQGKGEHGRGTSRPDIPLEIPTLQGLSRMIDDLLGSQFIPFQLTTGQATTGTHRLKMLGPQTWFFSFSSDTGHVQRFIQERGQGHGVPEQGAASRVRGSIDLNHKSLLRQKRFRNRGQRFEKNLVAVYYILVDTYGESANLTQRRKAS
jgi:hypothetical protein